MATVPKQIKVTPPYQPGLCHCFRATLLPRQLILVETKQVFKPKTISTLNHNLEVFMHKRWGSATNRLSRVTQEWEVLPNREEKEEWIRFKLITSISEQHRQRFSRPKAKPTRKTRKYRDEHTVIKMYQLLKVRNLYKLYIKNHGHSV